jgi:hypothetical protein
MMQALVDLRNRARHRVAAAEDTQPLVPLALHKLLRAHPMSFAA